MIHPEPTDTTPDTGLPRRGWVWHSTDASIAAGQISLLSVLETFCALGLYGWLAFHFDHQWWLLISAVAAPIILLRSPESKAKGLQLFRQYWESGNGSIFDHSKKREEVTVVEFIIIRIFLFLVFLLMAHVVWKNIDNIILHPASLIFYGIWSIPLTVICFLFPLEVLNRSVENLISYHVLMFSLIAGSRGVANNGQLFLISALVLSIFSFNSPHGILLRSITIRIHSTLSFPWIGISQLPKNWHENLFLVDMTYLPELLPGAKLISDELTCERGFREVKIGKTLAKKTVASLFLLFWYPPALLWRWSLKATLWLWFPLALLLRPDKATDNVGKVRKDAVTQIWVSNLLLTVAIVVALWLGTGHFPPETVQSWAELAGENAGKWLEQLLALATPPNGLIEAVLWLCCSLVGLVWLYSQYVQKQSPKTLAEEDAIYEMHPEPKQLFLNHSRWLERLYVFLVVSFILLGYAVVLHVANQYYPLELQRFIPAWLLDYL